MVTNVLWLVVICVFGSVESIDSYSIPPFNERQMIFEYNLALALFIIASIFTILHAYCYWLIHKRRLLDTLVESKERTVESLVANKDWKGLYEMALFGTQLPTDKELRSV